MSVTAPRKAAFPSQPRKPINLWSVHTITLIIPIIIILYLLLKVAYLDSKITIYSLYTQVQ